MLPIVLDLGKLVAPAEYQKLVYHPLIQLVAVRFQAFQQRHPRSTIRTGVELDDGL
jgi:hypothetical protein